MRATNIHSGKQTSFNQLCDRLLFAAIAKALEEYNIRKRQRKERQSELKGKNVVGVVDQDSESDEAPSLADTTSTAANNASLRVRISSLLSFSSSSPLLSSTHLTSSSVPVPSPPRRSVRVYTAALQLCTAGACYSSRPRGDFATYYEETKRESDG